MVGVTGSIPVAPTIYNIDTIGVARTGKLNVSRDLVSDRGSLQKTTAPSLPRVIVVAREIEMAGHLVHPKRQAVPH